MTDGVLHFPALKNRYFALRHGHSKANEQSIIVSDPGVGTQSYGLSDLGREQLSALVLELPSLFDSELKIVSSDFLRARESAMIIADSLVVQTPVSYSENLRERYFGDLEGQSANCYREVWERDRVDPGHDDFAVEPATVVATRAVGLIVELESQFSDAVILLVAHGDVLQLLQCAFECRPPDFHRQLPPLDVAEVRELSPAL
ncbi:MAG: histidine phosphatase family protein [Halioglobus sp.]